MIYLIFNEGYAAHAGEALVRHELCEEAIRLGGMLAELIPDEPEVLGLLALMELQASRAATRTDADGQLVLLADQDRARWNPDRIARGLAGLERAARSTGRDPTSCRPPSPRATRAPAPGRRRTGRASSSSTTR